MYNDNNEDNRGYAGFRNNPAAAPFEAPEAPYAAGAPYTHETPYAAGVPYTREPSFTPEPVNHEPVIPEPQQTDAGGINQFPPAPVESTLLTPPQEAFESAVVQPVATFEPPVQQSFPVRAREMIGARAFVPYNEDWREPTYSQTHETTSGMYTPGIYTSHQYSRKREVEAKPEQNGRPQSGLLSRLLWAACVIILCAALSGAAAFAVIEFRLQRGDFDVQVAAGDTSYQVVLGSDSAVNRPTGGTMAPVSTTNGGLPPDVIYDMALTNVVGIETESPVYGGPGGFSGTSVTTVSGSGFIISSDGYILTNYHVVESAHLNGFPLKVYLSDESSHDAEVIGFEASSDIALIKINVVGLNPVVIGDSDNIRVGQRIYAVGNPFGDLVYTMTEGIVSALDRVVTVDDKRISAFQFDAAVNPGNSGGPIYDANGDVVGIVSMKIMGNSVEGIGFAIPINDAILIASELIEHGYITGRPLIGITVQTVTNGHADFYGWVVGSYVRSVAPGSAGERAGLAVGDIIIALGDTEVDSRDALLFTLRRYNAGDTTTLTVWRGGEELKLTITFDENLTAGQP